MHFDVLALEDCVASIQFTMPDHARTAVERYDGGILEISTPAGNQSGPRVIWSCIGTAVFTSLSRAL